MKLSEAQAARPLFDVGHTVFYYDRNERFQQGEVLGIEANWYHPSDDPLIIYTLRHPTYRNRLFYTTADRIVTKPAGLRALQGGKDG